MAIDKQHLEFHALDMAGGWQTPPGYPPGIEEKILAGNLDEENKRGGRTRLLRIKAGVYTTEPFRHDCWEEVCLLSDDLTVGSDADGLGGENFKPPTYACRPPHTDHGPFKSEGGCVMFEIYYYDPA